LDKLTNHKGGKIMATFDTSCGVPILDGTCTIVGTTCSSYTSTKAGAGTVTNLPSTPGWSVHFRVSFSGVPQQFVIRANPSGSNFNGKANDGSKTEETWAATATEPAAAAKAN
jgi:hypothetical protein